MFQKSFWTGAKVVSSKTDIFAANTSVLDDFESVPSNLRRGISIQNVTKVYKLCDKASLTAVDNVSINFYHGEISALLGHNGAGKTTIFSIITGRKETK